MMLLSLIKYVQNKVFTETGVHLGNGSEIYWVSKSAEKTELVIVTGLSGAGKSRAVDALEDIGLFLCWIIMPPKLIPTFCQVEFLILTQKRDRVAIVADIRLGDSFSDIFGVLDELKEDEINYKILFIDADNDVIMRRYQETRRKHPLADEFNTPSILEAIQKRNVRYCCLHVYKRII